MAERRSRKSRMPSLKSLFGKMGIDASSLTVQEMVNPFTGQPVQEKVAPNGKDISADLEDQIYRAALRRRLEAESVLYYVETRGAHFEEKECKNCGETFAHTHAPVAYCSDICRAESLKKLGISWNIYGKTDSERWDGRIPKVIEPRAYAAAREALEADRAAKEAAFSIALQNTLEEMDIAEQEREAKLIEYNELVEQGLLEPTEDEEE